MEMVKGTCGNRHRNEGAREDPPTNGIVRHDYHMRRSGSDERIVGGQEALEHSFPYQAALFLPVKGGKSFCGGSVIADQWLLTAAHCVDSWSLLRLVSPAEVVLGAHNIRKVENSQVNLTSGEVHVHPGWNRSTLRDDLALIKLSRSIQYNDNIRPVRLPSRAQMSESFAGEKATVSGWGLTSDGKKEVSFSHLQVSQSTTMRIIKQDLHTYKCTVVHQLLNVDKAARVQFCEWFLSNIAPEVLQNGNVFSSDKHGSICQAAEQTNLCHPVLQIYPSVIPSCGSGNSPHTLEELQANIITAIDAIPQHVLGLDSSAGPELRFITQPVMSNFLCNLLFFGAVASTHVCTSGEGGRNTCSGDSGGPLVIEEADGERTQIGVVSFGLALSCQIGWPAAYTRVSSYMDWVSQVTGIPIRD
ncbi:hypothetical protein PR048_008543 [Dryococelus australis]|uniref:Peptidase S1 domain-containing protein n=1 Tax=Dryococelus australis TaxID=614101 RepID=A0ABQ9HXF3_9NEOP|nr:hypothetical protein PR048_008543 [Dryococelus australis]